MVRNGELFKIFTAYADISIRKFYVRIVDLILSNFFDQLSASPERPLGDREGRRSPKIQHLRNFSATKLKHSNFLGIHQVERKREEERESKRRERDLERGG